MKTQEDYVKEILELKAKNPEMEIHFCVDLDYTAKGCKGYLADHKIFNVEIRPWFNDDEQILINKSNIINYFNYCLTGLGLTEEKIKKLIDEKYEKEVKDVICVFTEAG